MKKDEKAKVDTKTKPVTVSLIKQEMSQLSDLKAEYTDQQRAFMRGLINPDLKDTELLLFLKYAESLRLSPFRKEIIAVVYNKNSADRVVNTIVTKDGKMVIARQTGELDGVESKAIYVKETRQKIHEMVDGKTVATTLSDIVETKRVEAWEGGRLWGAEATVIRGGKKFSVVVPLSEYSSGKSIWSSKPSTMIKKVALSQALTLAFPEILGGVYDESELPMAQGKELPASPEDDKPATEQQKNTLKTLGVEYSTDDLALLTFGQAKQAILDASQKKTKKGGQE